MAKSPTVSGKQIREFSVNKNSGITELQDFFVSGSFQQEFNVTSSNIDFSEFKYISQLLSDAVSSTENIIINFSGFRNFSDAIAAAESLRFNFNKVLSDTVSATELILVRSDFSRTFSDNTSSIDQLSFAFNGSYIDTSTISDTPIFSVNKIFQDNASTVDSLTRIDFTKALFDTANADDLVGVFDGITYSFGKNVTDNTSITDSLSTVYTGFRTLSDTSSSTDDLTFDINKFLSDLANADDLIGISDGITFSLIKDLSDNVATVDVLTRIVDFARTFTDTSSITDALKYALETSASDTASVTESILVSLGIILDEIVSSSDTLDSISINKALFDTANADDLVGVFDGITYSFGKNVSDVSSVIESLAKAISTIQSDTANSADTGTLINRSYFASDFVEFDNNNLSGSYDAINLESI